MMKMKDRIIPMLIVLGFSLFCGFVIIANGLGTLTSPLNRIAGPAICGGRQFEIERDGSAHIQGEQTHKVTAYCVDERNGKKQDVSYELLAGIAKLQIAAGFLSSLIFFALAMTFLTRAARRLKIPFEEMFKPSVRKSQDGS